MTIIESLQDDVKDLQTTVRSLHSHLKDLARIVGLQEKTIESLTPQPEPEVTSPVTPPRVN